MPSPKLRRIQRPSLRKKTHKTLHRVSHYTLRNNRERCIEELKQLGAGCYTNGFFNKAMILLTRYWAKTPWSGRAELLRTADWLTRVGARGFPPASPDAHHISGRVRNHLAANRD